MSHYFVGLMSGTSLDSIDVVIASIENNQCNIIKKHQYDFPLELIQQITKICTPGDNEIDQLGCLDNQLGELYADAVNETLTLASLKADQITAIGCHGQTIRHRPEKQSPFTMQIGNPNIICDRTNITTVADFRRADMAAGGQGAPLVPAFHAAMFTKSDTKRVVLNLGGIANISILANATNNGVSGFDTGPANILMNCWILENQNKTYDENGNWASSVDHDESLLRQMLSDPYFSLPAPKSTGREYFNLGWIQEHLINHPKLDPAVIQSTLCELSVTTIKDAINNSVDSIDQLITCGGGTQNKHLIARLQASIDCDVFSSAELGIDPDYIEALAFAWLAKQTLEHKPGNIPSVTGARKNKILGAIYYCR